MADFCVSSMDLLHPLCFYAWLYIFCLSKSVCFCQCTLVPAPRPPQPHLTVTIVPSALTVDLLTLCLVSGSDGQRSRWHRPSQWALCHLQSYCPLSARQWAALFWWRTVLARHAPSVNDERARESCAESAGLVWPTTLDAELIGRRLSPLTVTRVICGD